MTEQAKEGADNAKLVQMVTSSAHQIWLAGLGAFSKAQAEGTKLFESLVKEGEAVQARAAKSVGDQMGDLARNASGAWDRLENALQDRVSKSLNRIGIPTHGEIRKLTQHVDTLNQNVEALLKSGKTARKRPASSRASRSA